MATTDSKFRARVQELPPIQRPKSYRKEDDEKDSSSALVQAREPSSFPQSQAQHFRTMGQNARNWPRNAANAVKDSALGQAVTREAQTLGRTMRDSLSYPERWGATPNRARIKPDLSATKNRAAPGSDVLGPTGTSREPGLPRWVSALHQHLQDRASPAPGSDVLGPTGMSREKPAGPKPAKASTTGPKPTDPIPLREGVVLPAGALERAYNQQQASPETAQHTPSGVPGIYRRQGEDGVPEFYNLRPDGTAPEPLKEGAVSYVPSGAAAALAAGGGWQQRQALHEAELAAIRRGDHPDQIAAAKARSRSSAGGSRLDVDGLLSQANKLYEQAARTSDARTRAGLLRQAKGLQASATLAGDLQNNQADRSQDQREAELTALAKAQSAAQEGRASEALALYRTANAEHLRAQTQNLLNGGSVEPPEEPDASLLNVLYEQAAADDPVAQQQLDYIQNRYVNDLAAYDVQQIMSEFGLSFAELQEMYNNGELEGTRVGERMNQLMRGMSGVQTFSEGGLVGEPTGALSFAEGGLVPSMEDQMGPTGSGAMNMTGEPVAAGMGGALMNPAMIEPDPIQMEYREYAQGAEQLGIPAIPYEEFVQMRAHTPGQPEDMARDAGGMGAMGFAEGGQVPDVSGQMVVDTDPEAPTDSIPAVIDGQQPAALDSGEFVLPRFAVMYHGTDKLNKLIEQAKRGQSDAGDRGQAPTTA